MASTPPDVVHWTGEGQASDGAGAIVEVVEVATITG
jgi:hypothetical protein